jgi:hypothetical protein
MKKRRTAMLSYRRGTLGLSVLLFLALTTLLPLSAQDDLSMLTQQWKSQDFQGILQQLLDYRDTLGDEGSFEVDYMIGTTMCHWAQFKDDGRKYLLKLPKAYPGGRFEGQIVNISQAIQFHCGRGAVSARDDDSAGVDGKADSPGGVTAKNAQGIREEVKKSLRQSFILESNVDRPGQDYHVLNLPEPRPDLCRQACAKDSTCKAFTYVKPTYQAANARCWLKSDVPNPAPNKCCISAVK